MIDVTDALDELYESITLESATVGSRDANGDYVAGTPITSTIQAVVQSLNSNELLTLPEGERTKKLIKLHTKEVLKTVNVFNSTSADKLIYNGEVYKVINVFDRLNNGGYMKAIAVREDG